MVPVNTAGPLNFMNARFYMTLINALIRRCSWTFLIVSAAAATRAADKPAAESLPWEKGAIKAGGFVSIFDSTLTFGLENSGASLNAEDLLGLDSTLVVFRAEAMYRPGDSLRHQIDFGYAGYHRDGHATISREVTVRNTTIPVGAEIDSVFNFDVIRATYSYAIVQDERMRIALGLSAYVIPVKYSLEVQTGGGRNSINGADTALPLPALAFRSEFQLVPKLFLYASLDGTYLEVDDFRGAMLDGNIGLEYRPWKHFGFGLGYGGMLVKVESDSDRSNYPGADFVGTVDVSYSGLLLYGKVSF